MNTLNIIQPTELNHWTNHSVQSDSDIFKHKALKHNIKSTHYDTNKHIQSLHTLIWHDNRQGNSIHFVIFQDQAKISVNFFLLLFFSFYFNSWIKLSIVVMQNIKCERSTVNDIIINMLLHQHMCMSHVHASYPGNSRKTHLNFFHLTNIHLVDKRFSCVSAVLITQRWDNESVNKNYQDFKRSVYKKENHFKFLLR